MKKQILLVLLAMFSQIIFAQNTTKLKVKESVEFKDKVKSGGIHAFYTSDNGFTAMVRANKKHYLFDIFDNDLKKVFSKVIESDKKESTIGNLFYRNEIKMVTVHSTSKRERTIYCHVFNLKEQTHKKVELFNATVEKKQSLFSGSNKRETSVAISPNGKYFAVATDNIKKNLNSYTIRVFDSNTLKLVYKKSYQEHKEKYFQPNDLVVDDSGAVYALGRQFLEGKSQKKKGEANYDFILNKITKDDTKTLLLKLDNEHIQSLVIHKEEDHLKLIGFYSEKNVNRIKGGISILIDAVNMNVKDKKAVVLPKTVYEDLYSYRKANKKKEKELSSFYVDYVIEDSFGNTFLLAEEFYVTTTYVPTGTTGGYWQTVYHYDDILILKFDKNGDLSWGRSVFKRSTTPSYNAFLKDDKLHIILNSGKSLTEKKDGRTKVSKGWFESSSLYDFVYESNGDVSYDKIQDNKGNTYYIPYYGDYNNGKFIMTSSGRKRKQFMILE